MTAADRQWAAYLLRRAGFGATPDELEMYAALGYEGAVERLLAPEQVDDSAALDLVETLAAMMDPDTQILDGMALWLLRMMYTQRPLQEKMALFWHNHFATADGKVNYPPAMYQQNQLFLRVGLGSFDALLAGVARDPAMIVWLDNNTNRKGHPNENWGREVMELFTVGIGHYTEQDVKEVARAFTGWSATRTGAFTFLPHAHDAGVKTVLGQTGPLDGDDVLTILAGKRETGQFLAGKMWRWFVNDTPAPDGVERLADVYVQSGHDIRAMLRALFLSPAFRADASYYTTVKNPPEFLVGLLKLSGAATALRDAPTPAALRLLAADLAAMGMPLFNPPNVGGWPGGRSWINPGTYFARANTVERLLNGRAGGGPAADLVGLMGTLSAQSAQGIVDAVLEWALPAAPTAPLRDPLVAYLGGAPRAAQLPGLVRLVLSSPSYQMN